MNTIINNLHQNPAVFLASLVISVFRCLVLSESIPILLQFSADLTGNAGVVLDMGPLYVSAHL